LFRPNTDEHFYTTSASERDNAAQKLGYNVEGTACFVLAGQASGSIPFFRMFNATSGDHFYTTSAPERDNALNLGYTDEGVAAFVFPVPT
jgi:hypothetical protein